MTEYSVVVTQINYFLIESDSEEQAEKLVLAHKDLGLDLSGVFEIWARTEEEAYRYEPHAPYRTLRIE
jgi:hypothetical protein